MKKITKIVLFYTKKSCQEKMNVYNTPVLVIKRDDIPQTKRGCSSVVERNLAKVDVVGSNPIIRSL